MLKIFLGILGVILVVALLTNRSGEQPSVSVPPAPRADQRAADTSGAAARLNPPHGQPGHRCDIAVGAPLPSAAAPAPASNTSPFMQPAKQAAINPPHGQPGHDCSVPVGQPLP